MTQSLQSLRLTYSIKGKKLKYDKRIQRCRLSIKNFGKRQRRFFLSLKFPTSISFIIRKTQVCTGIAEVRSCNIASWSAFQYMSQFCYIVHRLQARGAGISFIIRLFAQDVFPFAGNDHISQSKLSSGQWRNFSSVFLSRSCRRSFPLVTKKHKASALLLRF